MNENMGQDKDGADLIFEQLSAIERSLSIIYDILDKIKAQKSTVRFAEFRQETPLW